MNWFSSKNVPSQFNTFMATNDDRGSATKNDDCGETIREPLAADVAGTTFRNENTTSHCEMNSSGTFYSPSHTSRENEHHSLLCSSARVCFPTTTACTPVKCDTVEHNDEVVSGVSDSTRDALWPLRYTKDALELCGTSPYSTRFIANNEASQPYKSGAFETERNSSTFVSSASRKHLTPCDNSRIHVHPTSRITATPKGCIYPPKATDLTKEVYHQSCDKPSSFYPFFEGRSLTQGYPLSDTHDGVSSTSPLPHEFFFNDTVNTMVVSNNYQHGPERSEKTTGRHYEQHDDKTQHCAQPKVSGGQSELVSQKLLSIPSTKQATPFHPSLGDPTWPSSHAQRAEKLKPVPKHNYSAPSLPVSLSLNKIPLYTSSGCSTILDGTLCTESTVTPQHAKNRQPGKPLSLVGLPSVDQPHGSSSSSSCFLNANSTGSKRHTDPYLQLPWTSLSSSVASGTGDLRSPGAPRQNTSRHQPTKHSFLSVDDACLCDYESHTSPSSLSSLAPHRLSTTRSPLHQDTSLTPLIPRGTPLPHTSPLRRLTSSSGDLPSVMSERTVGVEPNVVTKEKFQQLNKPFNTHVVSPTSDFLYSFVTVNPCNTHSLPSSNAFSSPKSYSALQDDSNAPFSMNESGVPKKNKACADQQDVLVPTQYTTKRRGHRVFSNNTGGLGTAQLTLIVNVPTSTTREDLINAFKKFGEVIMPTVVCRRETRHPKKEWTATAGYAFVLFDSHCSAKAALAASNMGEVIIRGASVNATWAKKDSFRSQSNLAARVSSQRHGQVKIFSNDFHDGPSQESDSFCVPIDNFKHPSIISKQPLLEQQQQQQQRPTEFQPHRQPLPPPPETVSDVSKQQSLWQEWGITYPSGPERQQSTLNGGSGESCDNYLQNTRVLEWLNSTVPEKQHYPYSMTKKNIDERVFSSGAEHALTASTLSPKLSSSQFSLTPHTGCQTSVDNVSSLEFFNAHSHSAATASIVSQLLSHASKPHEIVSSQQRSVHHAYNNLLCSPSQAVNRDSAPAITPSMFCTTGQYFGRTRTPFEYDMMLPHA